MRKERMRKATASVGGCTARPHPEAGLGDAHSAGPFNKHAELERDQDFCASVRTCR
jgi:hypothetical protein